MLSSKALGSQAQLRLARRKSTYSDIVQPENTRFTLTGIKHGAESGRQLTALHQAQMHGSLSDNERPFSRWDSTAGCCCLLAGRSSSVELVCCAGSASQQGWYWLCMMGLLLLMIIAYIFVQTPTRLLLLQSGQLDFSVIRPDSLELRIGSH